jgi:hypothetical protein
MQPKLAIAISADYNGRWSQRVVDDAKYAASGIGMAGASMGRALQGANGNVANLAAQFNDIGVQLAGGTSPFLIAVQQGTQIGQVIGAQGAGGAVKSLGTAFLSLLSPVNLLTIGAIALGGSIVQWLVSLGSEGPKAEETLKRHSQWLNSILEGYDEAGKAAQRYIDETTRLPQGAVQSELSVQQIAAQKEYLASLQEIKAVRASQVADEINLLKVAGENVAVQLSQAAAIEELQNQLSLTNPDLDAFVTELTVIKNTTADDAVRNMAVRMLQLADRARQAEAQVGSLNIALAQTATVGFRGLGVDAALAQIKQLTPEVRTVKDQLDDLFAANASEARTSSELEALATAVATAKATIDQQEAQKEATKLAKEAEAQSQRLAESYAGVTQRLQDQMAALGMTAIEHQKYEEVRAAGVDTNSKEADAIRASVEALNDRRDALEVINSMRSPAEIAEEEITRLAELYAKGELDAEQYAWAVNRALGKVSEGFGSTVSKVGDLLGSLSSIMQSTGEDQFGIAKGLAVASAVLKGYEAVTSAYAAGTLIGGPVVGAIYASAAAAATAAQIANIMSTTSSSKSMSKSNGGTSSPAAGATSGGVGQGVSISLTGNSFSANGVMGLLNELQSALGTQGKQITISHINGA